MGKYVDLSGNRYGRLVVLKRYDTTKNGGVRWLCKCDCGKETVVRGCHLKDGHTQSCGCLSQEFYEKKFNDLTNKKYGRLTVLHREHNNGKRTMWRCKCECGNETVVEYSALVSNATKSCGCLSKETNSLLFSTHKQSKTRLYHIWAGMKARCNNPKIPAYKYYGAKGITYTKEWENFKPFYMWALNNGYADDLTIDRINVNGNYEPNNCQWITLSENSKKAIIDRKALKDCGVLEDDSN